MGYWGAVVCSSDLAGREGPGAGAGGSSIGRLGRLVVFGGIVAATLLGAERFKKAYQ